MTTSELKVHCKSRGLKGYSKMKKEDMILLLTAEDEFISEYSGGLIKSVILFCSYCGDYVVSIDW